MHLAAAAPLRPQPINPTVPASARARDRLATAATAPVRSEVSEPASISASGSPFVASLTIKTPVTVGSPWRGLPGNDVTHFSAASSPPRTGIARKSPYGALSRYTFAGITQ